MSKLLLFCLLTFALMLIGCSTTAACSGFAGMGCSTWGMTCGQSVCAAFTGFGNCSCKKTKKVKENSHEEIR